MFGLLPPSSRLTRFKELEAVASTRLAIPLAEHAESLNVAVAAGILLYEVLRDR